MIAIQRKQKTYNLVISLVKPILNVLLNGGVYVYLIHRYSLGLVAISSFIMYLSAVSEFYGVIDALFFLFIDFYETNMILDELKGNVSFTYPEQAQSALKNIFLKINMGEKVILVGEKAVKCFFMPYGYRRVSR